MSDGHFNRALLPHTPYESGLRMGKAMARKWAAEAFADYLRATRSDLSAEALRQETECFAQLLARKMQ